MSEAERQSYRVKETGRQLQRNYRGDSTFTKNYRNCSTLQRITETVPHYKELQRLLHITRIIETCSTVQRITETVPHYNDTDCSI